MPDCPKCGTYLEVFVSSTKRGVDVSLVYEVPPPAVAPAPSPAHEKVEPEWNYKQARGVGTAKVEPTRAVFELEPNDVVTTTESGSTYLYRGDVCYLFAREDEKQPMVSWCHAGMRHADERNMHRSEIIELLNKRGITAKFPEDTPASDSVKGEVPPYPYDNKEIDMPTANPAAGAKDKPFSPTESWQEWIETEAEGAAHVLRDHDKAIAELTRRIEDLEREVAELRKVK